jgi:sugar diacid utilization regulator
LKFTTVGLPEQAVVAYETLGALGLLAELPSERLQVQPDVVALERLANTPSGAQDVQVLDVFCQTGSYRAAAIALYMHHSSVASRLAHVEDALGWPLDTADGRFRATVATLVRHLANNARG